MMGFLKKSLRQILSLSKTCTTSWSDIWWKLKDNLGKMTIPHTVSVWKWLTYLLRSMKLIWSKTPATYLRKLVFKFRKETFSQSCHHLKKDKSKTTVSFSNGKDSLQISKGKKNLKTNILVHSTSHY